MAITPIDISRVPGKYRNYMKLADMTEELGGDNDNRLDSQDEIDSTMGLCEEGGGDVVGLKNLIEAQQFQAGISANEANKEAMVLSELLLEHPEAIADLKDKILALGTIAIEPLIQALKNENSLVRNMVFGVLHELLTFGRYEDKYFAEKAQYIINKKENLEILLGFIPKYIKEQGLAKEMQIGQFDVDERAVKVEMLLGYLGENAHPYLMELFKEKGYWYIGLGALQIMGVEALPVYDWLCSYGTYDILFYNKIQTTLMFLQDAYPWNEQTKAVMEKVNSKCIRAAFAPPGEIEKMGDIAYVRKALFTDSIKVAAAGEKAMPALTKLMELGDLITKMRIVMILPGMGEIALPLLEKALKDPEEDIRGMAVRRLGEMGEPAIPVLIRALDCKDCWFVDANPVQSLSNIGDKAIKALVGCVKDKNRKTDERIHCSSALGMMGKQSSSAKPALREVIETDKNKEIRVAAKSAIQEIEISEIED